MFNLLADYQEIIVGYLTGIRAQSGVYFQFFLDSEEGSVKFTRSFGKDDLKVIYTFDKETLNMENPSAEVLKVALHSLKNTAKELLFPFNELTKYAVQD